MTFFFKATLDTGHGGMTGGLPTRVQNNSRNPPTSELRTAGSCTCEKPLLCSMDLDKADDSIWGAAGRPFVSPQTQLLSLLANYLTQSPSYSSGAPLVTRNIITALLGCKASEGESQQVDTQTCHYKSGGFWPNQNE